MKAFQSIRAEMRENCVSMTRPGATSKPPHVARRERREQREQEDGHDGSPIEPWMEAYFEALTQASETGAPFTLVPCFMNGKPAVVIALARPQGRRIHVMPLFLACQPWMNFSGQPGESEGDGDGDEQDRGTGRSGAGDSPEPR